MAGHLVQTLWDLAGVLPFQIINATVMAFLTGFQPPSARNKARVKHNLEDMRTVLLPHAAAAAAALQRQSATVAPGVHVELVYTTVIDVLKYGGGVYCIQYIGDRHRP
ncbi:hypothetical protein DFH08DRAFT_824099 [Mycena albidolilacea]|uniref:Uncharacterized protein n=1 Tax=Mycena albidolilacea TaxID=1033008 RepID=A0AAD6Z5C5_9AGAR|nr:hypothetical protein DFH08DRAFT_824099 [Mycena albidolilacea]